MARFNGKQSKAAQELIKMAGKKYDYCDKLKTAGFRAITFYFWVSDIHGNGAVKNMERRRKRFIKWLKEEGFLFELVTHQIMNGVRVYINSEFDFICFEHEYDLKQLKTGLDELMKGEDQ